MEFKDHCYSCSCAEVDNELTVADVEVELVPTFDVDVFCLSGGD